jgi:hypothetical protein
MVLVVHALFGVGRCNIKKSALTCNWYQPSLEAIVQQTHTDARMHQSGMSNWN